MIMQIYMKQNSLKIKKATDANLVKFLQTLEDSERMITVTNMALPRSIYVMLLEKASNF